MRLVQLWRNTTQEYGLFLGTLGNFFALSIVASIAYVLAVIFTYPILFAFDLDYSVWKASIGTASLILYEKLVLKEDEG